MDGTAIVLGGRQGIFLSIYFEANSDVLLDFSHPILEDVGRELAADPSLELIIHAYAAPFHTDEGRHMVSLWRAAFSRDYFIQNHGIDPERISYEYYGSDRTPILARTGIWESYRTVELIILGY